jgi:hypothetical protein
MTLDTGIDNNQNVLNNDSLPRPCLIWDYPRKQIASPCCIYRESRFDISNNYSSSWFTQSNTIERNLKNFNCGYEKEKKKTNKNMVGFLGFLIAGFGQKFFKSISFCLVQRFWKSYHFHDITLRGIFNFGSLVDIEVQEIDVQYICNWETGSKCWFPEVLLYCLCLTITDWSFPVKFVVVISYKLRFKMKIM